MLTYRLLKEEDGAKFYTFKPEGTKRPGVVAFYENGDREVLRESPDDEIGWYKGHALWGIDINTDSGTVAWY